MADNVEQTLAILKPEALKGGHTAFIFGKISSAGFKMVARGTFIPSLQELEEHYAEHIGQDYYSRLVQGMRDGDVTGLVLEKENAVKDWRDLMGSRKLGEAALGTIRHALMKEGDPEHWTYVHGADSLENAEREIEIWRPRLVFL